MVGIYMGYKPIRFLVNLFLLIQIFLCERRFLRFYTPQRSNRRLPTLPINLCLMKRRFRLLKRR